VAVLESASGPPFVVIQQKRLTLRGLPLPHPVVSSAYTQLPDGPELDLVRAAAPRRGSEAVGWLSGLSAPGGQLTLVVDPDQGVWLLERERRRRVASPLLVATLEQLVGARRPMSAEELAERDEGPAVEVLESRTGPPFVVVGGVRHPLRSLPLPFTVDEAGAVRLPEGAPLDVVRAIASRRHDRAVGWLQELAEGATGTPAVLVTAPDRSVWVVEGSVRRQVRSGLLVPLLEDLLGPRRDATEPELARPEGRVVEILESREGLPFLVVGGVRHPLRSLPVPFPVDEAGAAQLRQGVELDAGLLTRRLNELTKRDEEHRRAQAEREAKLDPVGDVKAYLARRRRA
jgi:hypothetical protein